MRIYRHPLPIRLTHWVNMFCILVLLMSGLQIFNAHPALYWGSVSNFENPFLVIGPETSEAGDQIGAVRILDQYMFETTGVLGLSAGGARAFPSWATLPSSQWLSMRHWHFTFVWIFVLNGLVYIGYSLATGHLRRGLVPTRRQIRHIPQTVIEHARLRFSEGEEARHYNVLQKLSYLAVILVLGPLMVLTGLTMSPAMNAAAPWMLDLFGGRQSARTIHFLAALGL
ncbi:cytochrome b/b6 domain-containing protein, partial [Loktanella sp. DJP18]|uniref:cytochrome b/b6 domain-containing protein n=1 Tax=Loktanella sp. DJP18 TaxID=3409788 RepID=UPI003BB8070F